MPRRDWIAVVGSAAAVAWAGPSLAVAKLRGKPISYDYVSSGVIKGSQSTVRMPDGSLDVRFEYTDRGRGPKLRSILRLDPGGMITDLHTTGYNYLKVPVDEWFRVRKSAVSWKNVSERQTHPGSPSRFYISLEGTPEEGAILARALLRAPGNELALWPDGKAALQKYQTITVANGSQRHRVTLFEIAGLDFSPGPVWLDEDGSLFMAGSEWGAVVPNGWKSSLQTLFDAQNERSAALGRTFARTLPQKVATAIALTNVSLFDSKTGALKENATLLVKGDRVAEVGTRDIPLPSDARRIEGSGKSVLPGLWDMHHHLADSQFGMRMLAQGVTTIRDPGNSPEVITRLQRQFESGELIGPRVLIAGLMDGKGKYTAPIGTTTDNADEAIAQVHDWKKRGAVQIKMYSSLNPKLVPVIAEEAHRLGMRVSGHVPSGMLAQDAVRQGFDEIQHVNFLFLNFMPDTKNLTHTPVRLTAAAQRAGSIDLQSQAVRDFVALLKEKNIVSDPTIGVFDFNCMARKGDIASTGYAEIVDWLPAQVRRGLMTGALPVGPGMDAKYRASAAAYKKMIALLHQNGIRIVAGTDDVLPGFDLIRELELYAQAGIPNAEVLQTATIQPARVMKMDDKLGALEPGMLADAIIVHGNPLHDIAQLRRVGTVIKGGVLYDARQLYAAAGVNAPVLA